MVLDRMSQEQRRGRLKGRLKPLRETGRDDPYVSTKSAGDEKQQRLGSWLVHWLAFESLSGTNWESRMRDLQIFCFTLC